MTNFHVIDDEPSPKIILPSGKFVTPIKIIGNQEYDLALLIIEEDYHDLVLPLPETLKILPEEPLIAAGYPMGTDLVGKATLLKGRFIDFRKSRADKIGYTQTDINLVKGMSGGPLVDQCGQVIGINTMGVAGVSLFIDGDWARMMISNFSDAEIKKIKVDPSLSPEEAVRAYYTYLKARRMEDGFKLLSSEYLQKTSFEEWTNRFKNILDVDVVSVKKYEGSKDTVFVKFSTKNWVENETEYHYYEGTWQTVFEDGVYKMLKSKIVEVNDPDSEWFY